MPTAKRDQPPEYWDRLFAPSSCLAVITTVDGVQSNTSSSVSLSAGEALNVDAVQHSTFHLGTSDALNTLYQWNFGDSGSAYNTLTGYNAGHIYQTAGTYTLTLTMTEGTVASPTVQVDGGRRSGGAASSNSR